MTDIFDNKYRYCIDIGKGNIIPLLAH